MKKFLSAALLIVWVVGCNQNKDISPSEECMPYSIRPESSGNAAVYEYDDKKRVTKIRNSFGDYIVEYTASSMADYYSGLKPTDGNHEMQTDGKGRITLYIKKANGPFESRLTYNLEGYLSKLIFNVKNSLLSTTDYTYTNGNLTQGVSTDNRGVKKTTKVTYYPDLKNAGRIAEYIFDDNLSESFLGRFELGYMMGNSVKNLPKQVDTGTGLTDYTYEFDSQNRITKITAQDPTATYRKQVYIITYDCG